MAMTEEERRAARNAASRKWYQEHKAAKAAQNKAGGARPKAGAPKTDLSRLLKNVERFAAKGEKTAAAYKALVKDGAALMAEAYASGDEKTIAKARRVFSKRLSLDVTVLQPESGKAALAPAIGAKTFRVPANKAGRQEPVAEPDTAMSKPSCEDAPEEKIVSVDPAMLTGIEDGTVTAADVDSRDDERDDDDKTDAQRLAELREKDPDDLTGDELDELAELEQIEQDQYDADGTAEAMLELEAQGAYDD